MARRCGVRGGGVRGAVGDRPCPSEHSGPWLAPDGRGNPGDTGAGSRRIAASGVGRPARRSGDASVSAEGQTGRDHRPASAKPKAVGPRIRPGAAVTRRPHRQHAGRGHGRRPDKDAPATGPHWRDSRYLWDSRPAGCQLLLRFKESAPGLAVHQKKGLSCLSPVTGWGGPLERVRPGTGLTD